jgi:hypothetical protein
MAPERGDQGDDIFGGLEKDIASEEEGGMSGKIQRYLNRRQLGKQAEQ